MVKYELPSEYTTVSDELKEVLRNSKLTRNNMRQVELMLRDNGADYFKIEVDKGRVDMNLWGQYDLIWKYHGLGNDFIVYIDFD